MIKESEEISDRKLYFAEQLFDAKTFEKTPSTWIQSLPVDNIAESFLKGGLTILLYVSEIKLVFG